MTFPSPPPRSSRPGGPATRRRRSPLLLTALVVGAVLLVITLLSQFWTEWFGGRVRLAVVAASGIAQMLPSVPAGESRNASTAMR